MKRLSILLFYLVAFVCLLNAKVIKGECGRRLTWKFDTTTGILSFAGPGVMYDYSAGTPWAAYATQIKALLLNSDVKDVPVYALKGCWLIEKIFVDNSNYFFTEGNCLITKKDSTLVYAGKDFTIPSSVRVIGKGTFYEHPSLVSLDIPEGVVTISDQAFAKCVSLKDINIPSTVKIIGVGAFARCTSITSVTIPSSTELINMGAFQNCTGLKSLTIEEGVRVIGKYAFQNCTSLASVLIPSSIYEIKSNAFDGCRIYDLKVAELNQTYCSSNNQIIQKKEAQFPGIDDRIFEITEENASFPGGDEACMKWLYKNISYPAVARENMIQGRVIVSFIVNRDGSIEDVKVVNSPDELLSQEAVRVIKLMPKWKPAIENHKTVRSRFNLPIMFRLDNLYLD